MRRLSRAIVVENLKAATSEDMKLTWSGIPLCHMAVSDKVLTGQGQPEKLCLSGAETDFNRII